MFLAPCAIGGVLRRCSSSPRLDDRRLALHEGRPWSLRDLVGAFHVHPRRDPDFAWAFAGRFLFICAYAFLTTYQAYYLLEQVGSAEAEVPQTGLPRHVWSSRPSWSSPPSALAGCPIAPGGGRSSSPRQR